MKSPQAAPESVLVDRGPRRPQKVWTVNRPTALERSGPQISANPGGPFRGPGRVNHAGLRAVPALGWLTLRVRLSRAVYATLVAVGTTAAFQVVVTYFFPQNLDFWADFMPRQIMASLLGNRSAESWVYYYIKLGGMIGMWVGQHAPQRIDRMVLCNTAAKIRDSTLLTNAVR